jgi:hypothetical protein
MLGNALLERWFTLPVGERLPRHAKLVRDGLVRQRVIGNELCRLLTLGCPSKFCQVL